MNEKAPLQSVESIPSIWPGLWDTDDKGPFLVGGRCKSCNYTTLEPRMICPSCWASDAMEKAPIGREGVLYTFTVIHQGPQGFAAPFAVGYVDLTEGVRVFAHLERTPETLQIGRKLVLAIEPLKVEGGVAQLGPMYRAVPKAASSR